MSVVVSCRLREPHLPGAAETPLRAALLSQVPSTAGCRERAVEDFCKLASFKPGLLKNLPACTQWYCRVEVLLEHGCGTVCAPALRQGDAGVVHRDRLPGFETSFSCLRPRNGRRHVPRASGPLLDEGPSCIFVGPVESAEKTSLEALYQQARDSYYSGRPLVVDEMFDRVEKRLRRHGSKVVVKYPRCSLRGYSAYADAEFDPSQLWALASVWSLLLASGVAVALGSPICIYNRACQATVHMHFVSRGTAVASEEIKLANWLVFIAMGLMAGIPVSIAAAKALQGLWRGDVVALKGCCPSCGEEVYAFIRSNESRPRHKTECHVCEHPLIFHVHVERLDPPAQAWAYGRVYLVTRPEDLAPPL